MAARRRIARAAQHSRHQQRDDRSPVRRRRRRHSHLGGSMKGSRTVAALAALALITVACGSDAASGKPAAITLVAYDSFPTEKTSLNDALDEFTKTTGIPVKIAIAGDAGTMVTKAKLTAGNPEGDVMWGVDNTLLSEAIDGKVFSKYEPDEVNAIDTRLSPLVPAHELTPVDYGDVCINYDKRGFALHNLKPPASLDDLTKQEYKDLLVVENPSTSSPGLAFLMATI